MRKRRTVIIIGAIVFVMAFAGFSVFAFGDMEGYDPGKEYRCPGVCTIQRVLDLG